MRKNKNLALVVASLLLATLWGCGSNMDSGGDQTGPGTEIADAAKLGSSSCKVCHTTVAVTENFNGSAHDDDAVAGCEGCHGGGQYHKGIGPIPYPNPVAAENLRCDQCHSTITPKVVASMHNAGGGRTGDSCQRCHTTQGFINLANKGYDPTSDAAYTALSPAPSSFQAPTCAACHDPHSGNLRVIKDWDPNQNSLADQFDLCTACHNLYGNDGNLLAAVSHHDSNWYRNIQTTHYDNPATASGAAPFKIEGYVIRTKGENPCFDCHGHELRTNTRRHTEPPQADPTYGSTIHTDWANSRHGGELLKVKVAAAAVVGATIADIKAAATEKGVGHGWSWTYYNWDDNATRAACQRCHTSTGAANFLTAPTTYVAANNDFSHVAAGQNEMLYCWGCHSSVDTGELRDPGALTIGYSNSASVTFPDSAASNVCIACHSGRENGDSIKNDTDADGVRSFLNSHYLTAGGIVFATGGYEYADMNYAFAANDRHQNIGYGAGTATGDVNFDAVSANYTSGPCVTCHFDSSDAYGQDRSHTLSPFTDTTADGTVLNAVCVVCHATRGVGDAADTWYGRDFTEANFVAGVQATEHKGRMLGAQLALKEVLASKDIYFYEAHPYFYTAPYVVGGTNTAFTNWAGIYGFEQWKNVMGAAFNYNLIAHDPGATAHNRRYARRLIYDSIDFLDDGIMNASTNATVTAQDKPFTTSALGYIGTRP